MLRQKNLLKSPTDFCSEEKLLPILVTWFAKRTDVSGLSWTWDNSAMSSFKNSVIHSIRRRLAPVWSGLSHRLQDRSLLFQVTWRWGTVNWKSSALTWPREKSSVATSSHRCASRFSVSLFLFFPGLLLFSLCLSYVDARTSTPYPAQGVRSQKRTRAIHWLGRLVRSFQKWWSSGSLNWILKAKRYLTCSSNLCSQTEQSITAK